MAFGLHDRFSVERIMCAMTERNAVGEISEGFNLYIRNCLRQRDVITQLKVVAAFADAAFFAGSLTAAETAITVSLVGKVAPLGQLAAKALTGSKIVNTVIEAASKYFVAR